MTPTVQYDVPFSEYLALDGWGSSALKAMRKGPPARVQWERTHPQDSDAMRLGAAVHAWMLYGGGVFSDLYALKTEGMSFATKDGKAWREEHKGKTILPYDDWQTVQAIAAALMSKPLVADSLLGRDAAEVSLQWVDDLSGEGAKGRPDWINGAYLYDLKVSRHALSASLGLKAFYEGWMHQLAHYRAGAVACGLPVTGGRLVVVTPTAPHFVYTLEVKPDSLDLLHMENQTTLARLRQCREADVWPDTPDEWTLVEPPPTALMLSDGLISGLTEEE